MIHHKHNQQWSDDNKMQICFKYSPTLDLNELRAVNKSQNFCQVFPSAAENISIIIILNSENFYLQSCTLCHLTCKNGVKERKKHHQTNTNSIKESKHGMTKRICVKGFNSVDGIRTGTHTQWIYIHHLFCCDRAVNETLGRFSQYLIYLKLCRLFAKLTSHPIIFANFEYQCPNFTLDSTVPK